MAVAEPRIHHLLRELRLRHAGKTALAVMAAGMPPVFALLYWQSQTYLPLLVLPIIAALIAAAFAWRDSAVLLARWLDDAIADLQDSSYLLQQTTLSSALARLQQQRVQQQLLQHADTIASILPAALPRIAYAISAAVTVLILAWFIWSAPVPEAKANAPQSSTPIAVPTVQLSVTPPAYTQLPPFVASVGEVTVPDGSEVELCLRAPTVDSFAGVEIQWLDGSARPATTVTDVSTGESKQCSTWLFNYSNGYRVLRAGEALPSLRGRLLLLPDAAPVITIVQPERDVQEVDSQHFLLELAIDIQDDYGLANATLRWTLARGGGENVRFTDREQRLKPGTDPKLWLHQQSVRLRSLGMEPGDELYFYLTAEDNRAPTHQQTRTRTYILRHPVDLAGAEAGARLPADLGKAKFRSQRQIILDTEALISQRQTLSPVQFRERSEKLAQDQMVLRLRYGEFLGEESSFESATTPAEGEHAGETGDEHDHGGGPEPVGIAARAQMNVLQAYGHAHDEAENATLFDEATKTILRRALRAMWSAEGGLRMSEPKQALPHEYEALKAIKELQQADRIYLHKTAFSPPPLEDSMRFSGDAPELRSLQRQHHALSDATQQLIQRVVSQLDQPDASPAAMSGDLSAVRQWLQDSLRRQQADGGDALTALTTLQEWQSGCPNCRVTLRDQLLPYLSAPLPAVAPPPISNESLRRQLQLDADARISTQAGGADSL